MNTRQIFLLITILAFAPLLGFLDNVIFPHVLAYYTHLTYFLLFMVAIFLFTKGIKTTTFNSISFFLFLLFLYYLLRSYILPVQSNQKLILTSYAWIMPVIAYITIIYNSTIKKQHIQFLISMIKVTIVVACFASLVQAIVNPSFWVFHGTSPSTISTVEDFYQRNLSIFSYLDSNDLGFSFLPMFSILLGYILQNKATNRTIIFWAFLAGITAFLSNARYVSFGFILILFQIFFNTSYVKNRRITLIGIFGVPITIFFLLQFIGYDLSDYVSNRLLSEESNASRITSFFLFTEHFPEAPYWGTGVRATQSLWRELGNSEGFMQIHIGFLSHLYEFGVIGSFFLFSVYYLIVRKLITTKRLTGFSGSLFGFIVFLFANLTLVDYGIYFYGLLFVFVFDKYYSQVNINLKSP